MHCMFPSCCEYEFKPSLNNHTNSFLHCFCASLLGNNVVVEGAAKLQARGFQCLPIRSPTVPTGQERIRIVLHAHNTAAEISALCECLEEVMDEYAYITDRSDTPSACSKKNDAEMTERIYSEA
jgi:hypothetical protein